MSDNIKLKIHDIKAITPDWEKKVLEALTGKATEEPDAEYMQSFFSILDDLYKEITEGKMNVENASDLFTGEIRKQTKRLLDNRLRSFYAFAPIRELNKEQRFQAEQLIDSIWEQYVLRFNPLTDTVNGLGLTKKQVEELMISIDGIAMYCISKLYTFEGIKNEIQDRTGLNEEWSSYLARRVDKDFSELRLNFIVNGITKLLNS